MNMHQQIDTPSMSEARLYSEKVVTYIHKKQCIGSSLKPKASSPSLKTFKLYILMKVCVY